MDVSTVIYWLVTIFLLVDGIYSIIKCSPIWPGAKEKYQKEKYGKTYGPAHRVFGIGILIGGVCFLIHEISLLTNWFNSGILLVIGLVFVVIGLVFYYLFLKGVIKIKEKEEQKDYGLEENIEKKVMPTPKKKEKSEDGISGYDN